ncbi:uncharacterized protein LOC113212113 [Frankliniella occidentalis]|uniref:Uncharacterized protein LOC113212113 n=1 Tax=Frankliniella occidentalis TaxID=133901 RepID=A0A6J1SZW7_FRAOC|nr:uncharacterized protein LOC113212113 [Frankliniella occidentalis]
MKTVMRTTLLACMLLAALQFAQAMPSLSAGLTETKAANNPSPKCIADVLSKSSTDVQSIIIGCIELAREHEASVPFALEFPLCVTMAVGGDAVRIAMDIYEKCWLGQ